MTTDGRERRKPVSGLLTVTMNPALDLSMTAPRIAPIRKTRCANVLRDPGGGGVNVARVLRRLGVRCSAFHTAGGSSGAQLIGLIEREGVPSIAYPIGQDTRENFAVRDDATGEEYRFVLPGPLLTADEWRGCLERLWTMVEPDDDVVASGSLPPGVPDDFYASLADLAAERGARLTLDTSGPALACALERGVHLVKPNLRELSDLLGRPLQTEAEWEEAALGLVRDGGARMVVLTLAERGALLVTETVVLRASSVALPVTSATGAGDSFLAGLVAKLRQGADLAEALGYGVAAGSAALLSAGTGLCLKDDVDRIAPEVRVHQRSL